jgi:DNA-binding LacI/PurR family transcriptional regulator
MRDVPGASQVTRERVRAVADELGYRPDSRARLLAGRSTRLLGVTLALHDPFHADVTDGIYRAAERLGYQVVLSAVTPVRTQRSAIETLLSYRCEALLLLGTSLRRVALTGLGERQPIVIIGQPSPTPGVDVVRAADAAGIGLAVEHLAGLGHRRIVHVDGARAPGAAPRRKGYSAAMRRIGLADFAQVIPGGESEEHGAAAARELAQRLPDAVITYNDRCAVGLLDVFARSGVDVPGDVSVVGYDDLQIARLPYLRLTTVSQDTGKLAELAVQRAVDRLSGAEVTDHEIVLAPHLVVRGTTAAARAR